MALQEIPKAWRESVCAVLQTQSDSVIQWTTDARQRYEAAPGAEWAYEAYDAFLSVLRKPTLGCPVVMEKPVGETYEFYVSFKGDTFYGKILLREDRRRVVIFSIHPQLKSGLSCE